MNNVLSHISFFGYHFYSPQWMWLLLLVPVILYTRYKYLEGKQGMIKFSRLDAELKKISFSPIRWIIGGTYLLWGVAMSLFILAVALPYKNTPHSIKHYGKGIDIIIAMDVSGSMMATDFLPNRLEVAKNVAIEFVNGRTTDRIGFVAFEGEAYTVCPVTQNYAYLKHKIEDVQTGLMEPGTAIGTGLGTAVARLRKDSLASKVIILLTDGVSNKGELSPLAAAHLARNKNIKVYTIGIGKKGIVSMPIHTPFGKIKQPTRVNIDEGLLEKIAEMTGGKYFRATNKNSLRLIYKKIDKMEKNKIPDDNMQKEPPYTPQLFIVWGIIFMMASVLVEQIVLKKNA